MPSLSASFNPCAVRPGVLRLVLGRSLRARPSEFTPFSVRPSLERLAAVCLAYSRNMPIVVIKGFALSIASIILSSPVSLFVSTGTYLF